MCVSNLSLNSFIVVLIMFSGDENRNVLIIFKLASICHVAINIISIKN